MINNLLHKTAVLLLCFALCMPGLQAQSPQTFYYTGGSETFVVPSGVTVLHVVAYGAAGGDGNSNTYSITTGGKGGKIEADLAVSPGQTLTIYVGGAGQIGGGGGFNGGGTGFNYSANLYRGGSGGGATDIRIGGTALSNRVLVAGGGGGGAASSSDKDGGDGGGLTGGNAPGTYGGQGGTQSAGGNSGGTLGAGGNGTTSNFCGGGGGGYYGGGTGTSFGSGGGGGGSSYSDPILCSNVIHTQGVQSEDGELTLSWTACTDPTAYNVTGGGYFCTGGAGVLVGLDASENGVSYQLQIDGIDTGTPVDGDINGGAISFGLQNIAGTCTVVATRTAGGCTANMTGSVDIYESLAITKLYVDADATMGNNDGSNWADAFTDLQSALTLACVDGAEIWVAEGTYYPTSGANRGALFNIPSGVQLYGGFMGTEDMLSQRNLALHPTILSGNIGDGGMTSDNSQRLIFIQNTTSGIRVDGFTIRDCSNEFGDGAITVGNSEAVFANCIISNNLAYNTCHVYAENSITTFENCEFKNGGGSACINNYLGGSMTLTNCSIHDNSGGVVQNAENSSLNAVNTLVFNNASPNTNGGAFGNHGFMTLTNCTVTGNTAYDNAGLGAFAATTVNNCIFWNNNGGGGIGGNLTVSYSDIQGGFTGTANISGNPLFVGGNDFHLQVCSPAVNTGDNASLLPTVTTDLDGNPRYFNSGTVDMGAFELQHVSDFPVVYALTGGGSNCSGNSLVTISLENSQTGNTYQLKKDGSNLGSPQSGTNGMALDFGIQSMTGTYTVVATNTASGCTANMSGSAVVIIPTHIYVNDDATGNNDGTSWADAYTDLQSALAIAHPCDSIWVAAGTYKPTTTADRGVYYIVPSGAKLYGGFDGTETQLSERDIAANPTILSGDIGNPGDNSDNSYLLLNMYNAEAGTRLDGFTISDANNGHTTGALLINGTSTVDVANCRFERDTAYAGGAIGLGGSTVNIDHCYFYHNYGGAGGGAIAAGDATVRVTNSIFDSNSGGDSGGAYFAQVSSDATFINCLFHGNKALHYNGSVMYTGGSATTSVKNCTITENTNRPALAFASAGTVENSIIWGNDGTFAYGGGTAVNSIVQGGYAGTGNINADPLFVGSGDYHLQVCSPAANKGDNALVPGGVTTDLGGNPRFFNTTVDMGAYEFQAPSYVPISLNLSGGGSDCNGATIDPVVLDSSETGINYQWTLNGANEGGSVSGTGLPLEFGTLTQDGNYSVIATDPGSGCSIHMNTVNVAHGETAVPFGETWYQQLEHTQTEGDNTGSVAFGNGVFVTVGYTYDMINYVDTALIFTSMDGISWTRQEAANGNTEKAFTRIAFGNGLFVAVGSAGLIQTSTDGVNWTDHSVSIMYNTFYGITYANGIWVAVGSSRLVYTSTDGITWDPASVSSEYDDFRQVTYGNGKFVAVGRNRVTITSNDGLNWSQTVGIAYGNGYYGLAYGEGLFVATGNNGHISTSSDGQIWADRSSGTTNLLNDVAYVNGEFIAMNYYATGSVFTSPDGICWAPKLTDFDNGFTGIAYNNGVYVAVRENGAIFSTVCGVPQAVGLTASGITCAEGSGAEILLDDSQVHYNYQFKKDGTPIGIPVAGTGAAISFGNQTEAGVYSVTASSLTGGCSGDMSNSVTIYAGETPAVATATPVCLGEAANLSATSSVGSIDWYDEATNGNLLTNTASGANYPVSPTITTTYYAQVHGVTLGQQSFMFTGAPQTFTVPDGVTKLTVVAKGASGGGGYYESTPGLGGIVTAEMTVTPGQVLNIYVGGTPTGDYTEVGGFNGGGSSYYYGGGGGASDIRVDGSDLTNRVLVAGGGGGAGYYLAFGGNGGGLTGQDGINDYYYPDDAKGGLGGTQFAGGLGGYGVDANGYDGVLGIGGNGGDYDYYGGGGGGGYYGGGGGGEYDGYVGGGGGGSSYTDPTPNLFSNVVHTQGANTGDGMIVLSWGDGCISPNRTPVTVTVKQMAISAAPGTCNGHNTTCTSDDTYPADVTVTYSEKPGTGTLSLSGADIVGTPPSVPVGTAGATSYVFHGVNLRADGAAIDLTATFSAGCSYNEPNAGTAPANCSAQSCNISNISIANISACNSNNTSTAADDYFTANVTVTFAYAPGSGNLVLKRGNLVIGNVAASSLSCVTSYTFNSVQMTANGAPILLTAEFTGCSYTTPSSLGNAPVSCSCTPAMTCPADVVVGTGANVCTATVTVPQPTITESCGGSYTLSNNHPSTTFPLDTTVVVWTGAGTCSMKVIVIDNRIPNITCPANQTRVQGAINNLPIPTVSDNCGVDHYDGRYKLGNNWTAWKRRNGSGGPSPLNTNIPNGIPNYVVGAYTMQYQVIDNSGNLKVCQFMLTVTATLAQNPDASAQTTLTPEADKAVIGEPLSDHPFDLFCYPNPFGDLLNISFHLTESANVQVSILDVTGRVVDVIAAKKMEAGEYILPFQANALSDGVYFVRMQADDRSITDKVILIK